jgi:hypothetical protein
MSRRSKRPSNNLYNELCSSDSEDDINDKKSKEVTPVNSDFEMLVKRALIKHDLYLRKLKIDYLKKDK